jgi:hypothetical protein
MNGSATSRCTCSAQDETPFRELSVAARFGRAGHTGRRADNLVTADLRSVAQYLSCTTPPCTSSCREAYRAELRLTLLPHATYVLIRLAACRNASPAETRQRKGKLSTSYGWRSRDQWPVPDPMDAIHSALGWQDRYTLQGRDRGALILTGPGSDSASRTGRRGHPTGEGAPVMRHPAEERGLGSSVYL